MTYLDVLENSDRDSIGEIEVVLIDGIGSVNINGGCYEIVEKERVRGPHRCILSYDTIDARYELFYEYRNIKKQITREKCPLKSVTEIVRKIVYQGK